MPHTLALTHSVTSRGDNGFRKKKKKRKRKRNESETNNNNKWNAPCARWQNPTMRNVVQSVRVSEMNLKGPTTHAAYANTSCHPWKYQHHALALHCPSAAAYTHIFFDTQIIIIGASTHAPHGLRMSVKIQTKSKRVWWCPYTTLSCETFCYYYEIAHRMIVYDENWIERRIECNNMAKHLICQSRRRRWRWDDERRKTTKKYFIIILCEISILNE